MTGPAAATGPAGRARRVAARTGLAVGLVALALGVRAAGVHIVTSDFRFYVIPWSWFIRKNGGFESLQFAFADYNVPYLYVLVALAWIVEHSPLPLLVGVKAVSVLFDAVLAWYAARLVSLRHPGWRVPALAAVAVLFLPSVVMNGAYWGQCDSIYVALALGGLYHLLRDRPWLACALLATAYAVKQQTIFILPVLLVLVLARRLPWRCLLAFPAGYLLLAVPAWIAGRPWSELLTIYLAQTGRFERLTLNAPSVFAFAPPGAPYDPLRNAGVLLAAAAFLVLTGVLLARRLPLDPQRVVLLATVCAIMAPLLLPAMHERYFYLADVLTVVAAFWLPRRLWAVPLLVQTASYVTYHAYVFTHPRAVDLRILAVLMAAALLLTLSELLRRPAPAPAPAPAELLSRRPPVALPACAPARQA